MKKKASNINNNNDEITDERFIAATNRPQFRSSGRNTNRQRHSNAKQSKSDHTKTNNNSNNNNNDDFGDGESGALHSTAIDTNNGAFGESLTEAIRSDDRFSEALTNEDKFGCVPLMDKYGRKVKKKKKKSRDDDVDNDSDDNSDGNDDSDDENEDEEQNQSKKKKAPMDMESRIAYLNALSRGEISASSSDDDDGSSDDDDDSDKSDDDDDDTSSTDVHGQAGVFDPTYNQLPGDLPDNDDEEMELTNDPTPYLCILNLDWEHTRAVDVYAMLHSFCPPGTLKRVDIYPSDYGRKMMEKERLEGPSGLWKKAVKKSQDDDDDESSSSGEESDAVNDGNTSEHDDDDDESDSDEEEDILNLDEATAKLYSHFPPQSAVMKKDRRGCNTLTTINLQKNLDKYPTRGVERYGIPMQ